MNKGMAVFLLMIGGVVSVFCLIAVFPMILEGAHEVNQTTNVTEYFGLAEINLLSPAIIWGLFIILILGSFGWIFRGAIKRRFFGGGGE